MAVQRITVVLELDTDPPGPPMWCVSSPDLPGLNTQGETIPDALEMAADAARGLADVALAQLAEMGRRLESGAK